MTRGTRPASAGGKRPTFSGPAKLKAGAQPASQPQLRVNLKFGVQDFKHMPFLDACNMIYNTLVTERSHCERFVGLLNKEHWIVSGVAKAVTGAKPPSDEMWEKSIAALIRAIGVHRAAYDAVPRGRRPDWYTEKEWKDYAIRQQLLTARYILLGAVSDYNKVHQAWYAYRHQMAAGAEAGKLFLQISFELLSAALAVGVTARVAAAASKIIVQSAARQIAKKAAISGGVKLVTEGAKAAGKKLHGIEDINYPALAGKALLAAFASAGGEVLSRAFLKVFAKAVDTTPTWSTVLKPLEYTKRDQLLANFFAARTGQVLLSEGVKAAAAAFAKDDKALLTADGREKFLKSVAGELAKKHALETFKTYLKNAL